MNGDFVGFYDSGSMSIILDVLLKMLMMQHRTSLLFLLLSSSLSSSSLFFLNSASSLLHVQHIGYPQKGSWVCWKNVFFSHKPNSTSEFSNLI